MQWQKISGLWSLEKGQILTVFPQISDFNPKLLTFFSEFWHLIWDFKLSVSEFKFFRQNSEVQPHNSDFFLKIRLNFRIITVFFRILIFSPTITIFFSDLILLIEFKHFFSEFLTLIPLFWRFLQNKTSDLRIVTFFLWILSFILTILTFF